MHHPITPAILYWGTPVVLISTLNADGTPNLAPMSSAWWLGDRCMLGLAAHSQTTQNLLRTKTCVLNLPNAMAPAVNALARTTGSTPVPEWKQSVGYVHVKDKFAHAGLSVQHSEVGAPMVRECPVQMEARLVVAHELMGDVSEKKGALLALEVEILRVYVEDGLRLRGCENRVDVDALRPLFMVFQEFFGMRMGRLEKSRLAEIGEERYRGLGMVAGREAEDIEKKSEV